MTNFFKVKNQNCMVGIQDDFDSGNFDFHDDSNFRNFLWPLEMLYNMEHSRGGSKCLRHCSLRK